MNSRNKLDEGEFFTKPTDSTFIQFALEARRANLKVILHNFPYLESRGFYIPSSTSIVDKITTIKEKIKTLKTLKSSRTKGVTVVDEGFYTRNYPKSYEKEYLAGMRASRVENIQREINQLELEIASYKNILENPSTTNPANYDEINQRVFNTRIESSNL